jgi:hypothetical protein
MNLGTAFTKFVLENIEKDVSDGLVGVEVGVRDGRNALDLCRYLNIKKLYLVDDFKAYQDGVAREYTQLQQEDEYQKLIRNTEEVFNKVIIVRMSSEEAFKFFEGKSFDFVYIDANHDYEFVKQDLKWWERLHHGGILGGHDYKSFDGDGVGRAVDEFAKEVNREIFDLGGRVRTPNGGAGGVEWAILK